MDIYTVYLYIITIIHIFYCLMDKANCSLAVRRINNEGHIALDGDARLCRFHSTAEKEQRIFIEANYWMKATSCRDKHRRLWRPAVATHPRTISRLSMSCGFRGAGPSIRNPLQAAKQRSCGYVRYLIPSIYSSPKGRVFKILIILMSNLSPKYPPN